MRHSGQDFRSTHSAAIGRCTLLSVFLAVGFALAFGLGAGKAKAQATGPGGANATQGEVTGVRLGRHANFLRLVFDLTARPEYTARATGARTFEVVLPGSVLPPEGHAALAADPLAPDLIVRPAGGDEAGDEADGRGPLRFGVASRFAAFIRRAFILDPPAGGLPSQAGHWRLVLDVVPRPGAPAVTPLGKITRADLPPLHGLDLPAKETEPHAPMAGTVASLTVPSVTEPGPGRPAQVEVSWSRASKILRELQDRQAPDAETGVPPQLVLAPKYRRPTVPLR